MEDAQISGLQADDIDALLALQEANQAEHGGMLSARMPRTFLAAAVDGMPVIVSQRDGRGSGSWCPRPSIRRRRRR
jgi:hypothetical protein